MSRTARLTSTGINGKIENHYQYDAFGVVQTHQEEIHNRIFYTGQQYGHSSGQYYLRARYYNPAVGRFLQEDVYCGDGLQAPGECAEFSTITHIYNKGEYINNYEHFTVISRRPGMIEPPCGICKVSSVNKERIDELIYGELTECKEV